jgi:hypothetical protein
MKSVFYKRQHGVWQRLEQGRRAWCDWGRTVSLVGHEARERGGGRRSLPSGSHDAGSRVTGRRIGSCGSGLIGKELDFGFSFDLFS